MARCTRHNGESWRCEREARLGRKLCEKCGERGRQRYTKSLAYRICMMLNREKRRRCHNPPPDLEPTMANARALLEKLRAPDGKLRCGLKRGGCKKLIDPTQCRNGAAPSLDHALSRLEAYWVGVEWHRASNLQLLHRDCHRNKDTVVVGDLYMREVKNPRSERC